MVGRANPESDLRLFVQLPDRNCRHASNDIIASDDGNKNLRKGTQSYFSSPQLQFALNGAFF